MSKGQKKFLALLLSLTLLAALTAGAMAETRGASFLLGGSIRWTGEPDTDKLRPNSVTVRLLADGQEIDTTTVTAADDWCFSFTVAATDGVLPTYTFAADGAIGYEEVTDAHIDPTAAFHSPKGSDWEKYEPCSSLTIPSEKFSHYILAGKMTKHRPMVIWTEIPLSEEAQEAVFHSLLGLPGVGNPNGAVFISGDGAGKYGMHVSAADSTVSFDKTSDWSLLLGGEYSIDFSTDDGEIVYRWLPVWDGPNTPPTDEPDTPPVDTPDEPPMDEPPVDEPPVDEPPVDEPNPATPTDTPPLDDGHGDTYTPDADPDPVPAPEVDVTPAPTHPKGNGGNGSHSSSSTGTTSATSPQDTTVVTAAKTGMPADYAISVCLLTLSATALTGLFLWKKYLP